MATIVKIGKLTKDAEKKVIENILHEANVTDITIIPRIQEMIVKNGTVFTVQSVTHDYDRKVIKIMVRDKY